MSPNLRPAVIREDCILAVDPGSLRIGLAVGETASGTSVPLKTLDVRNLSLEDQALALAGVAREAGATRILVGLPLNMDGSEGRAARRARSLGLRISAASRLPVFYLDERLTTEAAREAARAAGARRRSGKPVDDLAAMILLRGWLDEQKALEARRRLDGPETPR